MQVSECCEENFLDHCDGNSEDKDERNGSAAHEASEGTKDSIWSWAREHSCDILAKNLATLGLACVLRT